MTFEASMFDFATSVLLNTKQSFVPSLTETEIMEADNFYFMFTPKNLKPHVFKLLVILLSSK